MEIDHVEEYVSGSFYKRELPCLLALVEDLGENPEIIIVDGFVFLGKEQKAGLGKYLYDALGQKIAVIGVAKNSFEDSPKEQEVFRGESKKALFVTSVGIEQKLAASYIKKMSGQYRLPSLLKRVDKLCRGTA